MQLHQSEQCRLPDVTGYCAYLKAEGCYFEKKLQCKNARKEYIQIIQGLGVTLGFPFVLCACFCVKAFEYMCM